VNKRFLITKCFELLGGNSLSWKDKSVEELMKMPVSWRCLTVEEIEKIDGITPYEAERIHRLFQKSSELVTKLRNPKQELKRVKIIKKIVDNLPCTFSVMQRRTKLSKPVISRYLKLLTELHIVKKQLDPPTELFIYHLDEVISVRDEPFFGVGGVLDVLYSQKEYWVSRSLRDESKVKLARAGKKPNIKSHRDKEKVIV
jgi:DNA-binding transcriptional ArsR family regulator